MPADDLFTWLDALWNKTQPEGTPPTYMMHRFLVSEKELAQACRVMQMDVREPVLVFRIWQGLLPKGRGAPRLPYAAAKKPPAADKLVVRMMDVLGERRDIVEGMVETLQVVAPHRAAALFTYYGVEE